MMLVAVHPDSASLQFHLQIGDQEFRKVGQYIDLRRIEVYGGPTLAVRQLLQEKAEMLGRKANVVMRERSVGYARIGTAHPRADRILSVTTPAFVMGCLLIRRASA
jgi:hypothetical protein